MSDPVIPAIPSTEAVDPLLRFQLDLVQKIFSGLHILRFDVQQLQLGRLPEAHVRGLKQEIQRQLLEVYSYFTEETAQ